MGLDMHLEKHVYVGAHYEHRHIEGVIDLKIGDKPINVDLKKVSYTAEKVGYWRKANAIHKWFVDNVQDGKDDCGTYYVSFEQLSELKNLCQKALKTKDGSLLPPQAGFFFGSTEIDDWYFEDLKLTIDIINSLDKDGVYYYRSSW